MTPHMKTLKNFLNATLLVLPILLLYRLFSHEEFTRGDYILMIVLSLAGIISLATEAYKKKKKKKSLDQG